MTNSRSLARPLAALLAGVALIALLPAVADARLLLQAKPDPAAPAGKAPKVQFILLGTSRGQKYSVSATKVSGESALNEQGFPVVCSTVMGRLQFERSPGGRFALTPALNSYEIGGTRPCRGTYKGKVELDRGSRPSKVLMTFRLLMPSMRLTHVTIPR